MSALTALALLAVALPLAMAIVLLVAMTTDRRLGEAWIAGGAMSAMALHTLGSAVLTARVLWAGPIAVDLGQWYGDAEYALELRFLVDLPGCLALLVISWSGLLVLRFSKAYLHRDPGMARFFSICLLALACMDWIALAASLDLLFVGWELLGLCSFMGIGFFHARQQTVDRALHAFVSYRMGDLGLLFALILLHVHHVELGLGVPVAVPGWLAAVTGLGLVWTAAGKTGLVPFSGWLSRSVEGPTPASALFYGGLSVAAGPWLLLRAWPLYADAPAARLGMGAVGLLTAVSAATHARTRADVKGAVVMAGLGQNGLVVVEIALGLHTLAAVHLVANLGLRTWQLLHAPNVLHVQHRRDTLVGAPPPGPRRLGLRVWLWAREGSLERPTARWATILMRAARGLDAVSQRVEQVAVGGRDEDRP